MDGPKCSIVTPVLNRRSMIGAALDSVRAQGIGDCEHLVVDGGSTDGTKEIVAATPGARLIEAPGSSLYEAVNLGIGEARGTIIGLLNSDDLLSEGALKAVLTAFEADPAVDMIHGRAATIRLDRSGALPTDASAGELVPLDLRRILLGVPAINAIFMARAAFDRVGPFDTRLRIAADREWLARAVLAGASVGCIDKVLYVYRAHAKSLTIGGGKAAELDWVGEHLAFARRHLADPALDGEARRTFAAFHGKEVVREALIRLRRGETRSCMRALGRAFRSRPHWPIDVLPLLPEALRKRLMSSDGSGRAGRFP